MKKFKISEDLVPLSRRQRTALTLIIACVFQFVLFFTPVLAAEAVTLAQGDIKMDTTSKSEADPIVADLIKNANITVDTENVEVATDKLETNTPAIKVIRTSTHTITAYNSDPAQTDNTPCITANGFNVCKHGEEDTIAANFLQFGTKVRIPELYGDRIFVVRDRMNKRYSDRIDIWMKEKTDARQFGVKVAKIEVVEFID
ncbi:MAG TPA: hypothetical protein PKY61_01820 [bacterium]|jgi:3D (Asp-Asp-Asp) domain-containing protein|nr:hypothetical protein [bacterium]HPY99411.1 hypothetical protein [bacterium]HQB76623.1 hypothetical protein [bacterium]HQL34656.1 hypothetical protein [bacterium]